ncbi:DNA replication accessory factor [Vombatid gammaherpesvirus 1]|uniref:DNA replication accessory factor n=1 Tax=Vombatid gammaherpesvirus 1 TaxID=2052651 RepID=A0A3S8D7H6_9GAMA|nr:DNA replication accessory factor [Vombatid gammaherpesvirus 1]AZB49157.1 DNA replication accessory factor [Vombatid gammaherpesvirus 1]
MELCASLSLDPHIFRTQNRSLQHLKDICKHCCTYIVRSQNGKCEFGFYLPLESKDHVILSLEGVIIESYWAPQLASPLALVTEVSPWDHVAALHHPNILDLDIDVKGSPGGTSNFEVATSVVYVDPCTTAKYSIPACPFPELTDHPISATSSPSAIVSLSVKSQNELMKILKEFLEMGVNVVKVSVSSFLSIFNVTNGEFSFSMDYKMRPESKMGKRKRPQDEAYVSEDCECIVSTNNLLKTMKAFKIPRISNASFHLFNKRYLQVHGTHQPGECALYGLLYHMEDSFTQGMPSSYLEPRSPPATDQEDN